MARDRAPYPHCNTEVLHAPGECEFCDLYPERQRARKVSNTPFSPTQQRWPGNTPQGYQLPEAPETWKPRFHTEYEKHRWRVRPWFWTLWNNDTLVASGWARTRDRARFHATLARLNILLGIKP